MMRSLFSGVAGLKTHQIKMDVIGNNIANVNTVGYKTANVTFQDLVYRQKQIQPDLMTIQDVQVSTQSRSVSVLIWLPFTQT